ncbi:efflux RND transporter permease subunit [Limibacter armeniacum]|uniref:efflux RND transporter permease subunit n=1 Tax=Limibacter armeniacum TaxID=466084 RepID=UPI002FE629DC
MLQKFIERPVLSTVVSIIIVILGGLGMYLLPVTEYPDIAPPTVQVTASYPGANSQTILESVVVPIEEQINGVEGMTYMTSTASNDGSATIQVYFEGGIDPDIAAVNVQNRVSRANALLPKEVVQTGVITQKQQTSALMFLAFYSENKDYGEKFIQNYLNINVVPELQRIYGVGEVRLFGAKNYTMRLWVKPEKLANYNLTPADVSAALSDQSLEAAPGALGQNAGHAFEYTLRYKGRLKTEEEYRDIIIKTFDNGQYLRLGDVADVELEALSYSTTTIADGYPGINLGIFQTPGSNAKEIIETIEAKLKETESTLPDGIKYKINVNANDFLNASISKVISTLIEAFILVFIVVFIFLQDFRSTLIPAIAVPVAIIGTFFFLYVFGFSINLLTLFALVLAIGIVVDDAIVVVEAVHAKLDEGYDNAKSATLTAMSEISGAIISITLVMSAVFIPVTFMQGPTGVFYTQFGITLIIAILISAVNALTLSPALCALLLKTHDKDHAPKGGLQRFYTAFNTAFEVTTNKYKNALSFLSKKKWITIAILVASVAVTFWASETTPAGFIPDEDRGYIFANIETPAGSSLDRTQKTINQLDQELAKMSDVIESRSFVTGYSILSGAGSSYSLGIIKLKNWEERKAPGTDVKSVIGRLFGLSVKFPDAKLIFFSPPSIRGYGNASGFEFKVQDRTGGSFTDLDKNTKTLLGALMQRPEIMYASSSFNTNFPQYMIDVNTAKVKEAGLAVRDILTTMQMYLGGAYVNDFSRFGKQYRVYIQAPPEDRISKDDLNNIFVRTPKGEMAPITSFVSLNKVYGPQSVNRFNLYNSASVNGQVNPGFSTSQAIEIIEQTAKEVLPKGYDIDYSGLTREEVNSTGEAPLIFGLSILFVFFLLAAQYESYLLPLSVLLSLPVGIAGAFLSTKFLGLENNIYFQISLIMLVGLLAKNAILIVEFALQRRKAGLSLVDSALEAATSRLRPILMTSFAFILGLMPLAMATGVGAVGNRSIGTGAAGGMLIGTLLGVFVIPVLFIMFQWLQEKISGNKEEAVNPSSEKQLAEY